MKPSISLTLLSVTSMIMLSACGSDDSSPLPVASSSASVASQAPVSSAISSAAKSSVSSAASSMMQQSSQAVVIASSEEASSTPSSQTVSSVAVSSAAMDNKLESQFYNNGEDEVLVDLAQNITWVNDADACFAGVVNHFFNLCKDLEFAGSDNWRYPTAEELSDMTVRVAASGMTLNYIFPNCGVMTGSDGYVKTENSDDPGAIFSETPGNAGLRCVTTDDLHKVQSKLKSAVYKEGQDEVLLDFDQNLTWVNDVDGCFAGIIDMDAQNCNDLNFGGTDAWRTPTAAELSSMIKRVAEYDVSLNYILPTCGMMTGSDGWVKTENTNDPGTIVQDRPGNSGMRCVYEGILKEDTSMLESKVFNNGEDEVLLDHKQNLTWINDAEGCFAGITKPDTTVCADLTFGGADDWRYPTSAELSDMVKRMADNDRQLVYAFPNCGKITASDGWVMTENRNQPGKIFDTEPGNAGVRCVREGLLDESGSHSSANGSRLESKTYNNGEDEVLVDSAQGITWVNDVDNCFAGVTNPFFNLCKDMEFAGSDNWRYPTAEELSSMTKRVAEHDITLKYIFPNCGVMTGSNGWVKTENSNAPGEIFHEMPGNAGLRCVTTDDLHKTQSKLKSAVYKEGADEVLLDLEQNITWVNDIDGCFAGIVDMDAQNCSDLNFGGTDVWRTPTAAELSSMIKRAAEYEVALNYINPNCGMMTGIDGWVKTENTDEPGAIVQVRPGNSGIRCVYNGLLKEDTSMLVDQFFNSDADQVLYDHKQDLTWVNDADGCFAGVTKTDTTVCSDLEFAGVSDWRYPTSAELSDMIKRMADNDRQLVYAFPNCGKITASDGWVMTENRNQPGKLFDTEPDNAGVRCVRDGQIEARAAGSQLATKFLSDGDDEVLVDTKLNLTWVNDADSCFAGIVEQDTSSCSDLEFAGSTEWRYPTAVELSDLIKRGIEHGVEIKYANPFCNAGTASDGWVGTHNSATPGEILSNRPGNSGVRCVLEGQL